MQAITPQRVIRGRQAVGPTLLVKVPTARLVAIGSIAVVILVTVALLMVWIRSSSTKLGYEISRLSVDYSERTDENRALHIEVQNLSAPPQLMKKAAQLGFEKPNPAKVIVVNEGSGRN